MSEITGQIFNIQHFSTEDGPGIRTTVFFQGCPLNCLWCANPESKKYERQLAYRSAICVKCGTCIKTCKQGALSVENKAIVIDREKCISCGECSNVCPSKALFFYGEQKTVDEVFKEVLKDKGYYESSQGGVTCSGGECMSQYHFVAELFKRCKAENIHTTLDTCGEFSKEALKEVLPYTDLVLFDIKHMDSQKHKELTGVGNELIRENLLNTLKYPVTVYIRIPVIPGYNDSDDNLKATAEFIKRTDPSLHIDLLPYHKFGTSKYKMLNYEYELSEIVPPTDAQKEHYLSIFLSQGLNCTMH